MAQAAPVRRYSLGAARPMSAKLASVKDMLYHPNLPTFRQMDRDDVMRKLPTEHCRTTTTCSRGRLEASIHCMHEVWDWRRINHNACMHACTVWGRG